MLFYLSMCFTPDLPRSPKVTDYRLSISPISAHRTLRGPGPKTSGAAAQEALAAPLSAGPEGWPICCLSLAHVVLLGAVATGQRRAPSLSPPGVCKINKGAGPRPGVCFDSAVCICVPGVPPHDNHFVLEWQDRCAWKKIAPQSLWVKDTGGGGAAFFSS